MRPLGALEVFPGAVRRVLHARYSVRPAAVVPRRRARVQLVWWGWRRGLQWPVVGRWRYGPLARPEWWLFTGWLVGPVEVRVWRRDQPWESEAGG